MLEVAAGIGAAVHTAAAGIDPAAEPPDPLLDSTRPRRRHVEVGCKPWFPILSLFPNQ